MKIAIDVSQIIYGRGVSVYTDSLVRNLLKIDSENEYVLFGGSLRRFLELTGLVHNYHTTVRGSYRSRIYPIPPTLADFLWNRWHILPIETLIGKVDVFHSSDWTQPPSSAFKVTTVHDLSPIFYPESTKKDSIRDIAKTHARRLSWMAKEVDRVIAPSEATRDDLVRLGFDQKIIRVIYEAPGEEFKAKAKDEVEETKKKCKIRGAYLISVGVGGRKNTERLVKAFELARAGEGISLVLVGSPDYKLGEVRGVKLIGHVDQEELVSLYSGAEALVYPSLYEGFGLPILEAMKCGCPVLTSNLSSMAEVAGKAAVLVDPYDVSSIADGIKEALRGKRGLIKKGFARAAKFSWEKTARETIGVYNEAKS